jgi:LPS export ABC transporter protein LptC
MRKANKIFLFLLIVLGSCSLDYREGVESDELLDTVPDAVLNQFVHTAVNGNKPVFQLEAAQAKLFNNKKYTVLTGVRFVEYDNKGDISIEGRAQSAIYYNNTENAEIKGAIYCYSANDKVAFYAESLAWNKENRILQCRTGESVRIEKDDGSFIEGTYFSLDARRKLLNYDGAVRGNYFDEGTGEEKNK